MATVLVEWFIRRGAKAAAAFAEYRKPVPQGTRGFIDETLHRATLDGPEPAVVYINIGHWQSQEDFFRHFKTARPGVPPGKERFEARQRRRYWLSEAP